MASQEPAASGAPPTRDSSRPEYVGYYVQPPPAPPRSLPYSPRLYGMEVEYEAWRRSLGPEWQYAVQQAEQLARAKVMMRLGLPLPPELSYQVQNSVCLPVVVAPPTEVGTPEAIRQDDSSPKANGSVGKGKSKRKYKPNNGKKEPVQKTQQQNDGDSSEP